MPCSAKTKSGQRCKNKALANAEFCALHSKPTEDGGSRFEYDVFLSHSSINEKTVHALAERLREDGLRVWLDDWVIKPGDSIPMKIQHGVEKSRTLLMCMYPAYFKSQWDLETGQCHVTLEGVAWGIAVTPDGKVVVSSSDNALKFWSLETDECIAALDGVDDENWDVTVSHDGRTVVSSYSGNGLAVWDFDTRQIRRNCKGHSGSVLGLALSLDGRIPASGSTDNEVKLWDLQSGQCRATFEGHTGGVNGVAITPGGKIRWMNITEHLKRHGANTKQVLFEGEAFTAPNVALMRNRMLGEE